MSQRFRRNELPSRPNQSTSPQRKTVDDVNLQRRILARKGLNGAVTSQSSSTRNVKVAPPSPSTSNSHESPSVVDRGLPLPSETSTSSSNMKIIVDVQRILDNTSNEQQQRRTLQSIGTEVERLRNMLGGDGSGEVSPVIVDSIIGNALDDYYTKDEVYDVIESAIGGIDHGAVEHETRDAPPVIGVPVSMLEWDTDVLHPTGPVKIGSDEIVTTTTLNDAMSGKALADEVYKKKDVYNRDEVDDKITAASGNVSVKVSNIEWDVNELKADGPVTIGGDEIVTTTTLNDAMRGKAEADNVYKKNEVYRKDEVEDKIDAAVTTPLTIKVSELTWDVTELKGEGPVTIGGDEIVTTTALDDAVSEKAAANNVYTKTEVNDKIANISSPESVDVTKLTWSTNVLRDAGVVTIGNNDTGVLYVGHNIDDPNHGIVQVGTAMSGTGSGVVNVGVAQHQGTTGSGVVNVGASENGMGVGAVVIGAGADEARSMGTLMVGCKEDNGKGVVITSVGGVGSAKVNGKRVLVEGDVSSATVSKLEWDTNVLRGKDGKVVIGDGESGTLTVGTMVEEVVKKGRIVAVSWDGVDHRCAWSEDGGATWKRRGSLYGGSAWASVCCGKGGRLVAVAGEGSRERRGAGIGARHRPAH